jgi:tartrate dehydratase alpha subunit/fumarate hydratase class I-like protein
MVEVKIRCLKAGGGSPNNVYTWKYMKNDKIKILKIS